jgi:two-component system, NarL family, response regulator DevR
MVTSPVSGAGSGDEARQPIAVFLLDDHEVVRRGVRDLLEAEPDIKVIGEAGTASSALARIPALKPDVAVLDVRLPDGDGVSVCREIRSRMPEVACLMLTSFGDDEALFDAIMAGAAGYVLKQIRGTDLVPGREDGEELRVRAVRQAGHGAPHSGGRLRGARVRRPP